MNVEEVKQAGPGLPEDIDWRWKCTLMIYLNPLHFTLYWYLSLSIS